MWAVQPTKLLNLKVVPSPVPSAREILVEVYASGVSFPDVPMALKEYQTKPDLHFTPGLEMAGEIKAVSKELIKFFLWRRDIF